jgi:translation initiation factor 1
MKKNGAARDHGGLVYSTEQGRMCPDCRQPMDACRCHAGRSEPAPGDGVIRVSRETRGRKGAGVTLIRGVPLAGAELAALASRLKRRCGAGGTVTQGVIEIQGDHRDLVIEELKRPGWTVKRAGG